MLLACFAFWLFAVFSKTGSLNFRFGSLFSLPFSCFSSFPLQAVDASGEFLLVKSLLFIDALDSALDFLSLLLFLTAALLLICILVVENAASRSLVFALAVEAATSRLLIFALAVKAIAD